MSTHLLVRLRPHRTWFRMVYSTPADLHSYHLREGGYGGDSPEALRPDPVRDTPFLSAVFAELQQYPWLQVRGILVDVLNLSYPWYRLPAALIAARKINHKVARKLGMTAQVKADWR